MFAPSAEPNSSGSYAWIYRNGVIEMVDSMLLNRTLPDAEQRYIPGVGFERFMLEGIERGMRLLTHLAISAPVAIALTLTDVRGDVIGTDDWRFYNLHPVLNDHLFLPKTVLPEFAGSYDASIRPMADMVWNACGVQRSPHFDAEGNRTQRRR